MLPGKRWNRCPNRMLRLTNSMSRHVVYKREYRALRCRRLEVPMLFLLFQIREEWYALDVTQVIGVLPVVKFKPILQAPPGLVGLFNYHGTPVPLLDLSEL